MRIALINKKGGVGKTPFAFSLAKDLELYLQSNDNSCIEKIYPGKAKISNKVKAIDDCVFDFGGFAAAGVLDVIGQSDCVIVPCTAVFNSVLRTDETIKEILPFNKNIILLATNFKDAREEEILRAELDKRYPNFERFYFKQSKIVNNSINYGMSFSELYNESPIAKRSYSNFMAEYKKLIKVIKKFARKEEKDG